jgi:hypothetical protein
MGHGGPVGPPTGIRNATTSRRSDAIAGADWSSPESAHSAVVARMKRFLPTDDRQFLMELSIEPVVATQLGLASPTT